MLGFNKKVNTQKAMQRVAQQRLMRGETADANMLNTFGSLGEGNARQALSSVLRAGQSNKTQSNSIITQTTDANKRKAAGIINNVQKSNNKNGIGGSILGAIGE